MNRNGRADRFKERVREWSGVLDVSCRSIALRSMRAKWASCSTAGRFTFDRDVLDLSRDLQDYVIVHELVHFHVPNHGRLWKSLMTAHLGNYERLDTLLKRAHTAKVLPSRLGS